MIWMKWDTWKKEVTRNYSRRFIYLNNLDQVFPFDPYCWPSDLFLKIYLPIQYPIRLFVWEGFE